MLRYRKTRYALIRAEAAPATAILEDRMFDREAKRRRVVELRDRALDLVTAYGRIEGNIDFRGQLTRIRSWDEGRLHIELWSPRHPTGIDRGEQRPTTNMLTVRFGGEIKLKLGWDGDRLNLIKFEVGDWEDAVT